MNDIEWPKEWPSRLQTASPDFRQEYQQVPVALEELRESHYQGCRRCQRGRHCARWLELNRPD